jgi:hypothetical protein
MNRLLLPPLPTERKPLSPFQPKPSKPKVTRTHTSKRYYVAKEFLTTEENYVSILERLLQCYKIPLEDVFTVRQDRFVFGIIPSLIETHKRLLVSMKDVIANWSDESFLGPILEKWSQELQIYVNYATQLGEIQSMVYQLYSENQKFVDIVESCSTGEVYVGFRGFTALLITPIQRLMRYVILTQSLLKATQEDHFDHLSTASALEKFSVMVDHINQAKRVADHEFQAKQLERNLTGNLDLLKASIMESGEGHNFIQNPKLTLIYCDQCQKIILKDVFECTRCNALIHKQCQKSLEWPCGDLRRPKLISENQCLLGDWNDIGYRMLKSTVGSEFSDLLRQSYVPSSLFVFSDCLLITRKTKDDKHEAVAMVRWYSNRAQAWTEIQIVRAIEKDKKVVLVKITPGNSRKDFHDFHFEDTNAGEEFAKIVTEAIETKKKQMEELQMTPRISRTSTVSSTTFPGITQKSFYEFSILETVPVSCGVSKGGFYTAYVVNVLRYDGKAFDILKRYNQFYDLHSKLVKHYGSGMVENSCRLPKKHLFNTDPMLIQKRCAKLTRFLNDMNQLPEIWSIPCTKRFIETGVEDDEEDQDHLAPRIFRHFSTHKTRLSKDWKDEKEREKEEQLVGLQEAQPIIPTLETVQSEFDFEGQSSQELSFKKGEKISILSKEHGQWWYASKDGKTGYVPSTYFSK